MSGSGRLAPMATLIFETLDGLLESRKLPDDFRLPATSQSHPSMGYLPRIVTGRRRSLRPGAVSAALFRCDQDHRSRSGAVLILKAPDQRAAAGHRSQQDDPE